MPSTPPADALRDLRAHLATIADLRSAGDVLRWDQETYMPPGGAAGRAEVLATISRLAHEQFVSSTTGELLDAAEPRRERLPEDSDDAALIQVTRRDLDRARKLPADFVAEKARAASQSTQAWREARPRNDFAAFRPFLERMVGFARRTADYLGYAEHPYDALLDLYEPNMTSREVAALFAQLREGTVPLLRAIVARSGAVDDGVLRQGYAEEPVRRFALAAIQAFGYDLHRGRLDTSAHPFSTGFNRDDVRITTRYGPRGLGALFGTFHEAGHAMYSQGIAPSLERTPLARGASNGIHESQSRLWENLVGRSRPFWQHAFQALRREFPTQLGATDAEAFYRAVNRVEPSLIRVEADEVTYNLHIILRFELEQGLVAGEIAPRDLPGIWNAKMREYLGVTPPGDADGVMQDIHWSGGLMGYFPSYTIGNVASVQLFEAARRAYPDLVDRISRGEFAALLGWLREHVHAHGRKFFPRDLLQRATGDPLTPVPYLEYLDAKFGQLYGIERRAR
jgi:carboxypeptidase Taq